MRNPWVVPAAGFMLFVSVCGICFWSALERLPIAGAVQPGATLLTTPLRFAEMSSEHETRQERQVAVMRITCEGIFRCKACSHTFNKECTEEKEAW